MSVEPPTTDQCGCTRANTCIDRRRGRYLASIYWIALGRGGPVRTGEVSDRLDVRPASVTETFGRLDADGLVGYEKHVGVNLTRRGEAVARELAWRQCVVRTYFSTELALDVDPDVAYGIGFVLSRPGVERLRDIVDERPNACHYGIDRDDQSLLFDAECC